MWWALALYYHSSKRAGESPESVSVCRLKHTGESHKFNDSLTHIQHHSDDSIRKEWIYSLIQVFTPWRSVPSRKWMWYESLFTVTGVALLKSWIHALKSLSMNPDLWIQQVTHGVAYLPGLLILSTPCCRSKSMNHIFIPALCWTTPSGVFHGCWKGPASFVSIWHRSFVWKERWWNFYLPELVKHLTPRWWIFCVEGEAELCSDWTCSEGRCFARQVRVLSFFDIQTWQNKLFKKSP